MTDRPLIALLAAGRASRFGADKLAASCAGMPLGAHAARAVAESGLAALCITAPGPRPAWLPEGIAALPNPAAESGLGSSIALAARSAAERQASALVIHLADMPCISAALLHELAAAPGTAACRYPSGRPGVPVKFPAARFAELAALRGERGAAALLASDDAITLLACTTDDLADVDTPAALARAEALLTARRG